MTVKPVHMLIINVIIVCLLTSCNTLVKTLVAPANTTTAPKVPVVNYPRFSNPEFKEFESEIWTKLKAHDVTALEELAKGYREKKERLKGGGWKIPSFYAVISSPVPDNPSDADWEQHFAFLHEWKEKQINSITPRVALANAYLTYGQEARGVGYSNTVSSENRQIFEKRVAKAADELEEATSIKERCPGYYEAMLELATAQAWNNKSFDKVFDEATHYEPSYQYYYRAKALNLLPRWHGEQGDWEKFADSVKTKLGPEEGLKMYYQIVVNMSRYHGRDFFEKNQVSWEDTKKGFELFEKQYGMSREKLNEFGRLAIFAYDAQMSCQTFQRLSGENDFEPSVWDNQRKYFDRDKELGLQWCKFPKFENQAK